MISVRTGIIIIKLYIFIYNILPIMDITPMKIVLFILLVSIILLF
jgi:hypothetical protein